MRGENRTYGRLLHETAFWNGPYSSGYYFPEGALVFFRYLEKQQLAQDVRLVKEPVFCAGDKRVGVNVALLSPLEQLASVEIEVSDD